MSTAESVSSSGVFPSQACNCQTSTWSTPSRVSEPSSAESRCPREASRRRAFGTTAALVAITTVSRLTTVPSRLPRIRSASPSV